MEHRNPKKTHAMLRFDLMIAGALALAVGQMCIRDSRTAARIRDSFFMKAVKGLNIEQVETRLTAVYAVSYTHLDVYKRQLPCLMALSRRIISTCSVRSGFPYTSGKESATFRRMDSPRSRAALS